MKLIYNEKESGHQEIFERMKTMVLAFEKDTNAESDEIVLQDGGISYLGIKQINEHLDVIGGELHNWYYGSC